MKKEFLNKQKERLDEKKKTVEKELKTFAERSKEDKDDWKAKFPEQSGEVGGSQLEAAQDQVEEYLSLLPVERSLEENLKDVKWALQKIKNNTYGNCEGCGKNIPQERLEVCPEAKFCIKCKP